MLQSFQLKILKNPEKFSIISTINSEKSWKMFNQESQRIQKNPKEQQRSEYFKLIKWQLVNLGANEDGGSDDAFISKESII